MVTYSRREGRNCHHQTKGQLAPVCSLGIRPFFPRPRASMQSYCSGQRPSVTGDSVLTALSLLRLLPSKSSRCLRNCRTIRFAAASAAPLPFYKTAGRCVPGTRRNGSLSRDVLKSDPRVPLFASQNLGAVNVFYSRQVKSSGYSLASQKLPKKCQQTNQRSDGSCLPLLPAHTVSCSRFPVNSGSLEW